VVETKNLIRTGLHSRKKCRFFIPKNNNFIVASVNELDNY